jgi:hypothetical protein
VPSIKSAWTNLCKSENLRAIQTAISNYEMKMDQKVYTTTGKVKKPNVDYQGLKQAHKEIKEEVIETFKTEAFGDSLVDCIQRIEKDVLEKYTNFKNKFIIQYEAEFKRILAPLATALETKIRGDELETP